MKGLVWGLTFGDGIIKLEEIEANYNHMGIQTIQKINSKNNYQILLANGDIWKVARASENSRANRANISYVDRRIDPEFVNCVIRYCTYLPPFNAIRYFEAPRDCWPEEEDNVGD